MTDDEIKATRINNALIRNAACEKLRDMIVQYEAENIRHARTNSASDYHDLLAIEYQIAKLAGQAFGWDTYDEQKLIRDECLSECRFDLYEGCYINDQGDLLIGQCKPY